MKIRVIVRAAQGCAHAHAVVDSVSQQLMAGEELLIMEELACGEAAVVELESGARVAHISSEFKHDFDLAKSGMTNSGPSDLVPDLYVLFEDHSVPNERFMESLREFFANDERQGTTFYIRNGTPINPPSRALYAYVCGLADVESKREKIEPVTSSFAITSSALGGADVNAVKAVLSSMNFGWLQYTKVPELMHDPINQPPKDLYVVHCQVNTFSQAVSAIFWNARSNAVIDAGSLSLVSAGLRMPIKYLGRSVQVMWARPQDLPTSCMIFALGVCGYAGWWIGRFVGDSGAAEKIAAAHPVPATKQ